MTTQQYRHTAILNNSILLSSLPLSSCSDRNAAVSSPPSMTTSSSSSETKELMMRVEEEEEEEEFHESLDRILSSNSSSTSASDDESSTTNATADRRRNRNHRNVSFPPSSTSAYDVWTSEPSSVEERRRELLRRLGLIGDPALSRPRLGPAFDGGVGVVFSNSASPTVPFSRSRSDSSVSLNRGVVVDNNQHDHQHRNCSVHKPPLAKSGSCGASHRNGEVDGEGLGSRDGSDSRSYHGVNGEEDSHDNICTVKNLDNGEEFVVKEVREDGMWNKLREVGTGRQLTMEEFTRSVIGHSPIVEELMRRQNQQDSCGNGVSAGDGNGSVNGSWSKSKKRGSWFRSIKSMADNVVNGGEKSNSDEKDASSSSERGGGRSSSAMDYSQDFCLNQGSEKVKVRQYGRSWKELTGLYMNQEIHAHSGSIWTIKFSLDGKHLATAGEDCIIHVWQVVEMEKKRDLLRDKGREMENGGYFNRYAAVSNNGSPELTEVMSNSEKRRRAKITGTRKSFCLDHVIVPENIFALSEKPVCSFTGHQKDVLDLSWSKSMLLLSSSMDKTVKLWDVSSEACLKTFAHSDYVTCIQFNPVDDNYFISGSLDSKVRLWSIEQRQVVDWNDIREMVTAASYTPDGKAALVGSHKGNCNFYHISDNNLLEKSQINLQNKKKKSHPKKITGFQFVPGSSKVLVTSADSRIRVVDDLELVHKFTGFHNTSSQISASITADGKHVISASEDSHVYIWRYDAESRPSGSKGVATATQSYEYFHCRDVSVAIAWPGFSTDEMLQIKGLNSFSNPRTFFETANCMQKSYIPTYKCNGVSQNPILSGAKSNIFYDRTSATWPEEKLIGTTNNQIPYNSGELISQIHNRSAWQMVIVTAGHRGEIKIFQNFGYPVHV